MSPHGRCRHLLTRMSRAPRREIRRRRVAGGFGGDIQFEELRRAAGRRMAVTVAAPPASCRSATTTWAPRGERERNRRADAGPCARDQRTFLKARTCRHAADCPETVTRNPARPSPPVTTCSLASPPGCRRITVVPSDHHGLSSSAVATHPSPGCLRLANDADVPALEALIPARSVVCRDPHYSVAQMEAALGSVFYVDRQLIRDGTYFVVEQDGILLGAGSGWPTTCALAATAGGWRRMNFSIHGTRAESGILCFIPNGHGGARSPAAQPLVVRHGSVKSPSRGPPPVADMRSPGGWNFPSATDCPPRGSK